MKGRCFLNIWLISKKIFGVCLENLGGTLTELASNPS